MKSRALCPLQVTINDKEGFVTVENNGHGLPVEAFAGTFPCADVRKEHKEHKMYVPELVGIA